MQAHATHTQGAIGSRRDHGGIAAMQPLIAHRGWLGRCPATRKATVATARMRMGNSLFQRRIRKSLTTISDTEMEEKPAAGVHVGNYLRLPTYQCTLAFSTLKKIRERG